MSYGVLLGGECILLILAQLIPRPARPRNNSHHGDSVSTVCIEWYWFLPCTILPSYFINCTIHELLVFWNMPNPDPRPRNNHSLDLVMKLPSKELVSVLRQGLCFSTVFEDGRGGWDDGFHASNYRLKKEYFKTGWVICLWPYQAHTDIKFV